MVAASTHRSCFRNILSILKRLDPCGVWMVAMISTVYSSRCLQWLLESSLYTPELLDQHEWMDDLFGYFTKGVMHMAAQHNHESMLILLKHHDVTVNLLAQESSIGTPLLIAVDTTDPIP